MQCEKTVQYESVRTHAVLLLKIELAIQNVSVSASLPGCHVGTLLLMFSVLISSNKVMDFQFVFSQTFPDTKGGYGNCHYFAFVMITFLS